MTIAASVGTCVSVSATLPTTFDSAGYAALTYTQLGELEAIGEINVRHASVTFQNMCTGKTSTLKGAEEPVEVTLDVAIDRDDAGQTIMTAARKSLTQKVSVKVTEANGDIVYFHGYVMSDTINYGGINEVKKGQYTIGVIAPSSGDTVLVVNAA
jgi:hypothetical protein